MEIALSIDIGGTNTKLALVDSQGQIQAQSSVPTQGYESADAYFQQIFQTADRLRSQLSNADYFTGVGIGAPSCNGKTGKIVHAANLPFDESVSIVKIFEQHYDLPVHLINDSNAAALGEKRYGGAKEVENFLLLTLGTGLGCGIMLENRVITGKTGMAGELGHVNAVRNGRACGCGRKGCLETYVSATGIKRTAFELMATELDESPLRHIRFHDLTAKDIYQAAKLGDRLSLLAFEKTGRVLGHMLGEVATAIEPEAIFLSGGLSSAGSLLFMPTIDAMNETIISYLKNKVKILPSQLGTHEAAILGAASLVWENQKVKML